MHPTIRRRYFRINSVGGRESINSFLIISHLSNQKRVETKVLRYEETCSFLLSTASRSRQTIVFLSKFNQTTMFFPTTRKT